MPPDSLHQLRDGLYTGVLHPEQWGDVLDLLRQAVNGVVFHHLTVHRDTREVLYSFASEDVPAKTLRDYQEHLIHQDPRVPLALQTPLGEIMWDHEHLSQAEIDQHPVYAEFLKPNGYRHTVAVPLRDDGPKREILAFLRPHDSTPFGVAHQVLLQQLLPDLRRAAQLRARLDLADAAQAITAGQALYSLPQAVLLLDGECRIRFANPAAERLLSAKAAAASSAEATISGFLRSHHGRLECADPKAQASLERLVHAACAHRFVLPLQAKIGSFWVIPNTQCSRQRTVVNVLPLIREEVPDGRANKAPLALVLMSLQNTSHSELRIDPKVLEGTLNLTPSETRLALLLAQGLTLKEYSIQEDISWHTVRTHLRNLMRKTRINRQADLAQVLRNMLAT